MGMCCCCIISGTCILVGLFIVVYVYVFVENVPRSFHYEVTDASLTRFNLTADGTFLDCNLFLAIRLENPSHDEYNFNQLAAVPDFKDQNLVGAVTNLSKPFYLAPESNVTFPALFSGNQLVAFGAQEASSCFRNASVFDIVLKIDSEYWVRKKRITFKQEAACNLKVHPNSGETSSACAGYQRFQITKCEATKLEFTGTYSSDFLLDCVKKIITHGSCTSDMF